MTKKMEFNVSTRENIVLASLLNEISKQQYPIQVDIENGCVTVDNADEDICDTAMQLINKYYMILNVNIDDISYGNHFRELEPVSEKQKSVTIKQSLLEIFGTSLDKLDNTKGSREQIRNFLTDIGMTTSNEMLIQAFVIACDINKITYKNVVLELHDIYPNKKEEVIKANLQQEFKKWLNKYPELANKFPKLSLMSLLKVFVGKLK